MFSKNQAFLFNISEFERGTQPPLYIEFYGGDILAIKSDVLIVSAFVNDYWPVNGSVLGSIAQRFGFQFADHLPDGATTLSNKLHLFPTSECEAFKYLWVLDISEQGYKTPSQLIAAFSVLTRHLSDIARPA